MKTILLISTIVAVSTNVLAEDFAEFYNTKAGLVELWNLQNFGCRGGSGDLASTNNACDNREKIAKRLERMGCRINHTTKKWSC
jgi:hypothetical protein